MCVCLGSNPDPHRSFVVVGAHELHKKAEQYMAITHFLPHTGYRDLGNGHYINDIALIRLKKSIDYKKEVEKVSLPTIDDTFGPSSECWITGWGDVANNSE